ncbi:hypothetical protein FEM48_Zijuj09G0205500 [Ziziphus jujuba var. spinosa]|uniref:Uncharacterized protein n=1 Tax=Ziziphus jujuba var. spinosa TaxID=714518 RepID=A0A978UV62_ZIZJJ|nr:hypothetical protein FEM48_Zijuj09G0205500 [Ziziphus jujuba var. spinosa]
MPGNLKSLKVLNFSHNKLMDLLLPSLENLIVLKSLVLSSYLIVGGIPQQLKDITSLAVLNLSNSRLIGSIPCGKQSDTFENNSYSENFGLYGFPLSKICSSNIDHEARQQGDH